MTSETKEVDLKQLANLFVTQIRLNKGKTNDKKGPTVDSYLDGFLSRHLNHHPSYSISSEQRTEFLKEVVILINPTIEHGSLRSPTTLYNELRRFCKDNQLFEYNENYIVPWEDRFQPYAKTMSKNTRSTTTYVNQTRNYTKLRTI